MTEARRAYQRAHYQAHKEEKLAYQRAYRAADPERQRGYRKNNYLKHREARLEYTKKYNKEHRAEQTLKCREHRRAQLLKDRGFRLRDTLASRILLALKNRSKKAFSSEVLLGAPVEFVRGYLEAKFLPGMSWENHGQYGWHIDHIKPCANFDLSDPAQQKLCFHYSNLQPLWAMDNLRKGCKT